MTPEERELFQSLKKRMDNLELQLRTTQGQLQFEQFANGNVKNRVSTLERRTRYVRQPLPHVTDYMYRIRKNQPGYNWMGYPTR